MKASETRTNTAYRAPTGAGTPLAPGALAVWDVYPVGPVPCKVDELVAGTEAVVVLLTARRGPYRRGERLTVPRRHVVPRSHLITRRGQFRISGAPFHYVDDPTRTYH